jgi:hemolysin activation/secretion protein
MYSIHFRHNLALLLTVSLVMSDVALAESDAPPVPDAAKPRTETIPRIDRRPVPDEGSLFLVPPVTDRPLAVDEGERLIVRAFALRGVVDRPGYDLMIRDIEAILETQRLEKQRLQGDVIEGFTPGALVESAKILRELVDRRQRGEATEEDFQRVQELIKKLKDVEYNQGLTIGQLQEIVDEVTRFYRSKGFILAQAYIPAQTIANGVVIVQVLEGTLSSVVVEGNRRYSDQKIIAPFNSLIGLPVVKQPLESALLQLTDFPGLSAFGVFRPGENIGSSELLIKVQKEKIADVGLSLDNYGSEFTGQYRSVLHYSLYNSLSSKDRLFGNVYKTFSPNNGIFGSLSYEVAIPNIKNIVGLNISRNEFTLEQIDNSVPGTGETTIGGIYYRHTLRRSRASNRYAKIAFFRKRADVDLGTEGFEIPTRDDLAVLSLDFNYDALDPKTAGINMGFLRYSHGFDGILGIPKTGEETIDKLNPNASAEFDKMELGYTRYQSLGTTHSILLSLRGQYTEDNLASLEQMAIGGPDSVRAYSVAKYLRDNAYFATLEWIFKAPGAADVPAFGKRTWGDVMKMSIFYDIGGGSNNKEEGTGDNVTAMGLGVAFNVNINKFSARLDVAFPLNENEEEEDSGAQTYFSAGYQF